MRILVASLALVVMSIPPCTADQPIPTRRVFVDLQGLEVDSDFGWGYYYPSNLREWPARRIEARLVQAGWTIVDRDRGYAAAMEEQSREGLDPSTRPQRNKLWGASAAIELTIKIEVERYLGGLSAIGIKVGDLVKAKASFIGQIINTETGEIRPVAISSASKPGLHRMLLPRVFVRGRLEFVEGLDRTLVGQALDKAADRLVEELNKQFYLVPAQRGGQDQPLIFLNLVGQEAKPGDHFSIWNKDDVQVAEVEVVSVREGRALVRVISLKEEETLNQEGLAARPVQNTPREIVIPVER